jgi:hypothetical protein
MNRPSAVSDDIYLEALDRFGVVARLMRQARRRMLDDFMSMTEARQGDAILDIGVSDAIADEANYLQQFYPHRSDITCVGLSDGATILAAYPGVAYRKMEPGAPLPFPDKTFAIATCNAVLEHVGTDRQRRDLIADMRRVADRVFIAVPNRWFPVEHHTRTPLLHYWPAAFRAYCRNLGKEHWANPMNLEFLSPAKLRSLFPPDMRTEFRYSGLPLGPFSSNLVCIARSR